MLETLKGFLSSPHKRSKIIEVLTDRVVKDFSNLSQEEMCDFVSLTRYIEDEVASMGGNAEITYTTGVEIILQTVEPYIQEELSLLSISDLINAYIGFTHPHVSRPFQITNLIEAKIINMTLGQKLSLEDSVEVLHSFSQKKIGSKILIETVEDFVKTQITERFEKYEVECKLEEAIDSQTGYKCIIALNNIDLEDKEESIV